jgi:hypothetical protein
MPLPPDSIIFADQVKENVGIWLDSVSDYIDDIISDPSVNEAMANPDGSLTLIVRIPPILCRATLKEGQWRLRDVQ